MIIKDFRDKRGFIATNHMMAVSYEINYWKFILKLSFTDIQR